ncbi:NADPH-dependent 7-cyano-7-deazaguanine reductase-like [Penaeus monodon]|uniref:NADPH-dependent 7-cyano-7-deazaguanine reductase-like n=1 Tax=Penaeus monodon TaxID=6687 RepID=UPI0018A6F87F|nr:NADPH-dependent 7-cyano-7-deazaguanine reductase-like [Penaeus monodon]
MAKCPIQQKIFEGFFPTPSKMRRLVSEHIAEEFTSVCPVTGHPDFGVITLRYMPKPGSTGGVCIELKSLKLYYHSFRNEGIYFEAVTNTIRDDLVKAIDPQWLQIETNWKGRGGIRSVIRAGLRECAGAFSGAVTVA